MTDPSSRRAYGTTPADDAPLTVERPVTCPFCNRKAVDTLAKMYTARTLWQCRACTQTWTLASLATSSARRRV